MQKNLGQHFLTSQGAIATAVDALGAREGATVVEIGPGTGALTEPLLKHAGTVIAIEKDEHLAEQLREKHKDNKRLSVITGDIRDFDPASLGLDDYLLIGNIPYYITGRILRRVLSATSPPKRAVFVLQKEVADRIVIKDGKGSILSTSVHVYGTPKYVKTIKRGSFSPPPRVDSAILVIEDISHGFFADIDEELFFKTVRKGFAHKRKLLKNNLGIPSEELTACDMHQNARAEELTPMQWKCLAVLERNK